MHPLDPSISIAFGTDSEDPSFLVGLYKGLYTVGFKLSDFCTPIFTTIQPTDVHTAIIKHDSYAENKLSANSPFFL